MTGAFDWARLWRGAYLAHQQEPGAGTAYLRTRIEVAFVPVDWYSNMRDEAGLQTARAEAAEGKIERAKLEGVRAGIEAARETLKTVPTDKAALWDVNAAIRALDAAAIARRDSALSDLIAGDAHLIDTVGDSDGDDGA